MLSRLFFARRSSSLALVPVIALLITGLWNLGTIAPPLAAAKPVDDEASDDEMPEETKPGKAKSSSAKSKTSKSKTSKVAPKTKTTDKASARKALKYALEEGRRYVYEVEIAVDLGDSSQTIVGQSTYQVKSVGDDEIVLAHQSNLVRHVLPKAGTVRFRDPRHRGAFSGPPGLVNGPGEVTIDPYGKVKKNTGNSPLPFLLGETSTLVLEPLSPEGEARWEIVNDLAVGTRKQPSGGPGARSQAMRRAIRGESEQKQYVSSATEKTEYQRAGTKGDLVTIKRHSQLASAGGGDTGVPAWERESQGEITFDTKAGAPKKAEFKDTIKVTIGEISASVPVTVSYRLLSDAEIAKLEKQAADAKAAHEAAEAERNRPVDNAEVKKLLVDLKSPDKRRAALDRLAKGPANDQQPQVAKALAKLLGDPDNGVVKMAVVALGVWGTTDNVPALVKLFDEEDVFLKSDVMKTLAKLPSEPAAEALAKQLPFDRGNASRSLIEMGAVAEAAVIPYLEDRDEAVRKEACKILGEIGSSKGAAALEKFVKDARRGEINDGKRALKQISARE